MKGRDKMFKKLITLVVTAAVVATSMSSTFAADNKPVTDGKDTIIKVIELKGGTSREITLDEYNNKLAEFKKTEALKKQQASQLRDIITKEQSSVSTDKEVSPNAIIIPVYPRYLYEGRYTDYNYARYDLKRRISPIIQNSTISPAEYSVTYSATQGYTINLTLNGGKKDAFTIALGGTWTSTWSDSTTTKMTIQPSEYGWVEYVPLMTNYTGYMHYQEWDSANLVYVTKSTEYSDLCVANKSTIGNMPDGYYLLKTSYTNPY